MDEKLKKAVQLAPRAVHAKGSLKLVIFDCDGVLVESEHLVSQIVGQEARQYGWNLTDQEVRERFEGVQLKNIEKHIAEHVTKPLPANWKETIHDKIILAMKGDVRPMPGVKTVLKTLQELGIPYRVGSNSSHQEMDIKFRTTHLTHDFPKSHIHSSNDVSRPKPYPDLYLYVARQQGVAPQDCLVIEDSDTGLKAAYDAGMACILLRDLKKPAPDYSGVIRLPTLSDVAVFIKETVEEQRSGK